MNLNKSFMAVLAAAAMHSCVAGAPAYGQTTNSDSVVRVSPTGGGHGTGTYIGNGRFLTAAHVVTGQEGGTLTDFRGGKVPYLVVIIDESRDVAIVETREAVHLPVRTLDCRVPAIGEEVEFIGHPLKWDYVHGFGRVASRRVDIPGFASGVWVATAVGAGQSGSAMLAKDGRIVGIVNAGMHESHGSYTGYMFSVTGADICKVLGPNKDDSRVLLAALQ